MRHLPIFFAVTLLTSCFSSTPMEEHFYQLKGPLAPREKSGGPSLALAEFSASTGYESQRMAYRTSESEIGYYAYHKWAAEPTSVLREMVARHLRSCGFFKEVVGISRARTPEAVLEGEVVAMEEVDKGDSWEARLAMRLVLRDATTDMLLLQHAFDRSLPCKERHPREVARTISEILDKEMKALAPRLASAVKSVPEPVKTQE